MIPNKTTTTYGSEGLWFDSTWLHFPSLCKPSSSLPLRASGEDARYACLDIFRMFTVSQLTPKLSPLKVVPAI
jgi:hypothetical protein